MKRGILFGAGVSLATMISGHAEAGQSDLRKECAQEARLPTPDDNMGKRFGDVTRAKGGASAVLASLWSVADEPTAVLMQRFYAIHSKGGTSKAEALRQAQIALMAAQGGAGGDRGKGRSGSGQPTGPAVTGYAHPFYWAPFVLLGNWQ